MAIHYESPVCLAVLNPGGRDPFLDYAGGPGGYQKGVHAPVNFHAYAAATRGAFFDSTGEFLRSRDRFDAVLVLIRRRTWITLAAVQKLKNAGVTVLVAWKECSNDQISRQLQTVPAIRAYGEILELADGILSPTLAWPPRLGKIDQDSFSRKLKFIPTPYPLDFPFWDFSTPFNERSGILIGTREFGTDSRNHIQALARAASLAHEFDIPRVSVINSDKGKGLRLLRELALSFPAGCLTIHERPLPYLDYMKLVSSHRVTYQMDRGTVPGQVAGDCILARTICAGGSSTIEKLVFKEFSDDGTLQQREGCNKIALMLQDDNAYADEVAKSQEIATRLLSFQSVARQLGDWQILKRGR